MRTEPSHRLGSHVKEKGERRKLKGGQPAEHPCLSSLLPGVPNASRLLLAQQQANAPTTLFLCPEAVPSSHGRKPPSLDLLVGYLVTQMKAVQIQKSGLRAGRHGCKKPLFSGILYSRNCGRALQWTCRCEGPSSAMGRAQWTILVGVWRVPTERTTVKAGLMQWQEYCGACCEPT